VNAVARRGVDNKDSFSVRGPRFSFLNGALHSHGELYARLHRTVPFLRTGRRGAAGEERVFLHSRGARGWEGEVGTCTSHHVVRCGSSVVLTDIARARARGATIVVRLLRTHIYPRCVY
jgi:hypothetical protein